MELLLVLCLPRDAETAHVTREVLKASLTVLGVAAQRICRSPTAAGTAR
jgi:hypothetical protein